MKLYVNENLIFDGQLDKGSGEAPADQSILVGLQNENERVENTVNAHSEESRDACTVAGTDGDKELGVSCSQTAGAVVDGKVSSPGNLFGERSSSPDCMKDSSSKLEDDFSSLAPSASMGGMPSGPPFTPPVECPPLDQQLESLTGRKISEAPGKTPSWLQPSPTGKGKKQGGRKPKPLWLSPEKPLDWKDRLLSEDIISDIIGEGSGETEARDKAPRREQVRGSSWNVISGERAQRVTPKVCYDDFDIFNQPSNKERPASGRRGPKKDALSSGRGDGQLTGIGKLEKQSNLGSIIPGGGH